MAFWVTTSMDGADPYANPVIGEMKSEKAASLYIDGRVKTLAAEGFIELDRSDKSVTIYNPDTERVISYGVIQTKTRPKAESNRNGYDYQEDEEV